MLAGPLKIFLYGPPGVGKTTVGRRLAKALNIRFIDLDQWIEKNTQLSIQGIFNVHGEKWFRQKETQGLVEISKIKRCVVALGGGALLANENRELVEANGTVVVLQGSLQTILKHLKMHTDTRPLLGSTIDMEENLTKLLLLRQAHYESFPLRISIDNLSTGEITKRILIQTGHFSITDQDMVCDILVGEGARHTIGEYLTKREFTGPVAIIADTHVMPLFGKQLLQTLEESNHTAQIIPIPAGENAKNLETVHQIWDGLLKMGMDRSGMIIALGGGVTSDLAGFAAATFYRGIRWIAIPTTLLAMVDAAIGGKTGVDLLEGKNLIGAFHPPQLVLVDPFFLTTLPVSELRNGMAEVVKHGILTDPALFEICSTASQLMTHPEDHLEQWKHLISMAIHVKVAVVQKDPKESGLRACLNLGHTIGHAVETASGYQLKHGEAISIGLVAEARLAEKIGLARPGLSNKIKDTLESLNLVTEVPEWIVQEKIFNAIKFDKKNQVGKIKFTLPLSIGKFRINVELREENLAILKELL